MLHQATINDFRRIIKNKYFILYDKFIIKFTETSEAHKNDNYIAYKIIDIREIESHICMDLFDSSMFEQYLELYCRDLAINDYTYINCDKDTDEYYMVLNINRWNLNFTHLFKFNSDNYIKLKDFDDIEIYIRNYIIYDGVFPDCDAIYIE